MTDQKLTATQKGLLLLFALWIVSIAGTVGYIQGREQTRLEQMNELTERCDKMKSEIISVATVLNEVAGKFSRRISACEDALGIERTGEQQ